MKRVLITGGPTNEYIDEVMKITNMSSGKLAIELANYFSKDEYQVTLLITKGIKNALLDELSKRDNVGIVLFETTQELLQAIDTCAMMCTYDVIVHSAAVADYKPEFSFKMEDMARELAENIINELKYGDVEELNEDTLARDILEVLTNPNCKVNDDTKISSMEPHLTVKLGLTPKIITMLRGMFPNAYICGFKLLENVSEQDLIDAAMKQIAKCNTDLVFANDLAELRKGNAHRLVISRNGYKNVKVDGAYGIYNLIKIATENHNN